MYLTNTIGFYVDEFGDPMGEIPIEGKLKYSLVRYMGQLSKTN